MARSREKRITMPLLLPGHLNEIKKCCFGRRTIMIRPKFNQCPSFKKTWRKQIRQGFTWSSLLVSWNRLMNYDATFERYLFNLSKDILEYIALHNFLHNFYCIVLVSIFNHAYAEMTNRYYWFPCYSGTSMLQSVSVNIKWSRWSSIALCSIVCPIVSSPSWTQKDWVWCPAGSSSFWSASNLGRNGRQASNIPCISRNVCREDGKNMSWHLTKQIQVESYCVPFSSENWHVYLRSYKSR